MACAEYNRRKGYTATEAFSTVQTDIYNDGIGCINANMPSCATQCTNLTKTAQACYGCLGQASSCPASNCNIVPTDCASQPDDPCCSNATGSCCPLAELAVQCGTCLAANGNTAAAWTSCSQAQGLGTRTIVIIAVCCAVALVVVIAIVVVVVKLKAQARAREKLVVNLQREGVDPRIVRHIQNLNYSRIDSRIFHDADVHLALQQASQRVQPVPPPQNVAVEHTASATEGLFGL